MFWSGAVVTRTLPHSRWTTPQSLATLQSHAGAVECSGSLSEKHTLCTAGPHQRRPEGTTLKDMENWGRELPSIPLVGQIEPNRVCVNAAGVLLREIHGLS